MDLKGKAALVTGGGTGLGRAVTLQLAREGVNVAVNYSKSKEEADETVKMAESLGVKAAAFKADVSRAKEAEGLVRETAKFFGRLDILVNNAGTTKFVPYKNLDGLDEEDFLRLFRVNSMSNFFTSRAAQAEMKKNGGGCIVNTVSVAGIRPTGSSIAYAVSKASQIHMTKCLASALAPEIRVNGVAPGLLLTRWAEAFTQDHIEHMTNATLLKKTTDVDDCAAMYAAIVKNDSMTGQIVVVDAGQCV